MFPSELFSVIVTIYPSFSDSFVPGSTLKSALSKYFPSSSSKLSWIIPSPFSFANAPVADNFTFSSSSAIFVLSLASVALVSIPVISC